MSHVVDGEVRQRVTRWLEDGQGQLTALLAILSGYERLEVQAAEAQRESERMRAYVYENEKLRNQLETLEHEGMKLREEISRLKLDGDQHLKEREEIADLLTQMMNAALRRLRREAA